LKQLIHSSDILSTSRKPKVTIGVCVRNSAVTIREAIESMLTQDFPHKLIEVIFVDDGSEDETFSIIKNYIPRMDMQVKVFKHKWKGLGPSRNVVVNNASGDYIIWVDADMILPKDHVRKQVKFMEEHRKVGIAKAKYGMFLNENLVATLENIPYVIDDLRARSCNMKLPGTGGSIYRVKAIRHTGGFDENLVGVGEDQDAAYRIRDAGWLVKTSDAFLFERRENSWSVLWKKYVWYGYGNYFLYRKNKSVFRLYKMIPPTGFLAGLLYSFPAYRLIGRKIVFFLPLHYFFKFTAWCLGFISAHFKSKIKH